MAPVRADIPDFRSIDVQAAVNGRDAHNRGVVYARQGRVVNLSWDPRIERLSAMVRGSRPYKTTVQLVGSRALWKAAWSSCSCPMMSRCKHVAALLVTAMRGDFEVFGSPASGGPAADPGAASDPGPAVGRAAAPVVAQPPPQAAWRGTVARLTATESEAVPVPRVDPTPIGLQFRVDNITAVLDSRRAGRANHQVVTLSVRPVREVRPGSWEAGADLPWRKSPYTYTFHNIIFDQAQRDWLTALANLADLQPYHQGSQWLPLAGFAGTRLWDLLAEGRRLGVAFVGHAQRDSVVLADHAALSLDATRGPDGGLLWRRRLEVDGQAIPWSLLGTVGRDGLFAVDVSQGFRAVTLARARPRLGPDDLALTQLDSIEVPAADEAEFRRDFYPRLRRRLTLTSQDGTVDLPVPPRPVLVAQVAFPSVREADVRFSWDYAGASHPLLAWNDPSPQARDDRVEDEILTATDEALRALPEFADFRVDPRVAFDRGDGFEAVAFRELALPLLESSPDVRVEVADALPDYTRLDADPFVTVSTAATDDNDWFDLGVTVSVEGRPVPFQQLFLALASGEDRMLLDDGGIVRLDHPQLDRLRRLIEEARHLADRPDRGLSLNRYQAGLWEELEDVADAVDQADAWRESVAALTDLVKSGSTPRPTPLPKGLKADLRPYQRHAFDWLAFLHQHRLGGILADDMGLGKTVEALALIAHVRETTKKKERRPFLILAPASVVANWESEARRFTPDLRVTALSATLSRLGTTAAEVVKGADVVVTSYALFRLDFEDLAEQEWAGLLLDEAQFVKNAKTKGHELARRLKAPFKLAITGTPLENDLMELWALLALAAPGLHPNAHRFKEAYAKPIARAASLRRAAVAPPPWPRPRDWVEPVPPDENPEVVRGDRLLRRLRHRLRPLLLRRTKEEVAPELPPRQEHELLVDLAPRHRHVYDTFLQRERSHLLGLLDDFTKNRFAIFRSLTKLRRLALDASLVEPQKYADIPSAKLTTLFEQLDEVIGQGHRALVFSQFTTFLAKVRQGLERRGVDYEYLDGSTVNRPDVIARFRSGSAPVFCLSLKAGGFGLNLTEADYVFLLDP
ncbi:MAG: hypothetical protein LBS56_02905, partial [Propionibacteriaceae bacterium]|nr:hypothetical protein [Propionibacteriaceae bacterium]